MVEGILTGLIVALVVEVIVYSRGRLKRRSSVKSIKAHVHAARAEMESVQFEGHQPLGTGGMTVTTEQARYAIWRSHLQDLRTAVEQHSVHLDAEESLELLGSIDGFQRVAQLAPEGKILPAIVFEDEYFGKLEELGWLEQPASANEAGPRQPIRRSLAAIGQRLPKLNRSQKAKS